MKLSYAIICLVFLIPKANAGDVVRCEDISVDSMGFALDKNSSPFTGTVECQRKTYLSVKTTYRDGYKEGEETQNFTDPSGATSHMVIYKYKKGTAYETCMVQAERRSCYTINCADHNCKTP